MKTRSRLVVLKKFQSWFFLNFMFYGLTSLLCIGLGVFLWVKIVAKEIMQLAGLITEPVMSLLRSNAKMAFIIFGAVAVTLLALSVLQAFIFSRKIAGPLFAFTKHFEKCQRRGRLEKMNLRKGDLFVDLAASFNQIVENVNAEALGQPEKTVRKRVAGLVRLGRG